MEILLINHSLYTGGVETLMVRMANWLVRNGHGCSILLRETFAGDLVPVLDQRVRLRIVENRWDLLAIPILHKWIWESWNLPKPDFIYTMEQNWAVVGLLVRDVFGRDAPSVATGAYHLNQFAYEYVPAKFGRLALLRQEVYDRHYLDSQKFFMSEETRIGHERFFNRSLADGWVWPLPIEIPPARSSESRSPVPYRILSVGRLTLFKTYSWYMVPILYSLRGKYPDVQWHVYGFGACERELVDHVWQDAIRDGLIVFHGSIAYQEITSAFDQAAVFIGMGTTLLEAAASGVPSIPAIVDDHDAVSWGFIDQMPYFTVGETVPGMQPGEKVAELLETLFQSSTVDIEAIVAEGKAYLDVYSIEHLMDLLQQQVTAMNCGPRLTTRFKCRYLSIRFIKLLRNLYLSFARLGQASLRHAGGDRVIH